MMSEFMDSKIPERGFGKDNANLEISRLVCDLYI